MPIKSCGSILFLFILSTNMFCCKDPFLYEKNVPIEDMKWKNSNEIAFPISLNHSTEKRNLFFNIRHSAQYKYSNIYVLLTCQRPNAHYKEHLLEFSLAYPDGRWKGVGTGSILSYSLPIMADSLFLPSGVHTLTLQQYMRTNILEHVLDVGIRIE